MLETGTLTCHFIFFSLLQVSSLSGRNLWLPAHRSGRTTRSLTPLTFFRLPYIFIHSLALHSFTLRLCTCACVSKEPAIFSVFLGRAISFIFLFHLRVAAGGSAIICFSSPKFLELPSVEIFVQVQSVCFISSIL